MGDVFAFIATSHPLLVLVYHVVFIFSKQMNWRVNFQKDIFVEHIVIFRDSH